MASPQKENGHTEFNNENLERLYACPLSGGEFRIILCVIRKTWGWHKKSDSISISQLVAETKLSRKEVCKKIKHLVTKRLLAKDQTESINEYKFNKNYDEWVVTKRLLASNRKVTRVVTKRLPKVVTKRLPKVVTKRLPTKERKENKENITKETTTNVVGGKATEIDVFFDKKIEKRKSNLQELIDFAKELNFPLQGTERGNRFSASNTLKKFGLAGAKKLVQAAVGCRGEPFSPTINDFTGLYRRAADLVTFYAKKNKTNKGFKSYD